MTKNPFADAIKSFPTQVRTRAQSWLESNADTIALIGSDRVLDLIGKVNTGQTRAAQEAAFAALTDAERHLFQQNTISQVRRLKNERLRELWLLYSLSSELNAFVVDALHVGMKAAIASATGVPIAEAAGETTVADLPDTNDA